jgi:hypothetical protein
LAPAPQTKSIDPRIQAEIDRVNQKAVNALMCFLFTQGIFGVLVRIGVRVLVVCFRAINVVQKMQRVAQSGADFVISNASILTFKKSAL